MLCSICIKVFDEERRRFTALRNNPVNNIGQIMVSLIGRGCPDAE